MKRQFKGMKNAPWKRARYSFTEIAKVVGMFAAAGTLGFALGAPLANLCFDMVGNYNIAFIAFACMMIFVTVAMQFVVSAARKDRKIIEDRMQAEQ